MAATISPSRRAICATARTSTDLEVYGHVSFLRGGEDEDPEDFSSWADYTAETARIVADAGFLHACAAVGGAISSQADPFRLPRFMVEDWTGAEFDLRLRAALDAEPA